MDHSLPRHDADTLRPRKNLPNLRRIDWVQPREALPGGVGGERRNGTRRFLGVKRAEISYIDESPTFLNQQKRAKAEERKQ